MRQRMRNAFVSLALFAAALLVYNANGREIGSYDSQPTKYTALAFARHGDLTLDWAVGRVPLLAERPGFAIDRQGHYRTAYPIFPAIVAGSLMKALDAAHAIDVNAARMSGRVSKLSASILAALGVMLAFLLARQRLPATLALAVAAGLAFGTNLWAVTSQTLWQAETAVPAMMGALLCLARPAGELRAGALWGAGLLLGCAGAARPQMAPAIAVLALSTAWRRGRRADVLALLPIGLAAGAVIAANLWWFGHPLGALAILEARLHPVVHGVSGSFGNPLAGAAGLLVSPSRGLLIFSPVVIVASGAWAPLRTASWRDDLRWPAVAAIVQFGVYAAYSVWWGGHTFGPRYGIDLLPLLVPLAAAGLPWWLAVRWRRCVAAAALAWSILVAATGAFFYPNGAWNAMPDDVDTHHERLWDWRDSQLVRCWQAGPSPQNFQLFPAPGAPPSPPAPVR